MCNIILLQIDFERDEFEMSPFSAADQGVPLQNGCQDGGTYAQYSDSENSDEEFQRFKVFLL